MAAFWIARDKADAYQGDKSVYLFTREPYLRPDGVFVPHEVDDADFMRLPDDAFPDLTFEDSPKQVEMTIK